MKFSNWRGTVAALLCLQAGVALAQVQDYRDLKYPVLPDFQISKPTTFTLPNGLRVFLIEDHELPLISVSARVRTGSHYEPAEKRGLADLMGSVQRSGGTATRSGDEIDDYLAARAASVETGMGGDSGYASMDCLKQDFDDVFAVYADVLRSPAFAEDKLEVAKVAAKSMIARRNDQVNQIASREIRRIVYGNDSPLAQQQEYATINAVTRDDLLKWHQTFYHPNNIMIGVVGDFESDEMRRKIAARFEDWPKGPEFALRPVPYKKEPAPGLYFVEKSDVNQANIALAHLGIEVRNPDYFAAQVMNEILGGGFSSRMFSNVRSRQGLAYSVWGSLGAGYVEPGMFQAGLQTKMVNTTRAIAALRAEVDGIIATPPSASELKRAKDSILNSFIFNYDSKGKILAQQMTYAYYGLPADFLEQYRANIEKVEAGDVTRVAKKYVHPDQLAVLVVGKAADLDQPLSGLGKVTTIDISIPPPRDTAPKAEKSAENLAAGRKIWAEAVEAMGGAALKKVNAVRTTSSMTIDMAGQSLSLKQTLDFVFPDKVRQVIASPMGEQTIVASGRDAFLTMGGKSQTLPESAGEEMEKELRRNVAFLLRNHDDPDLEVVAAGTEKADGAEYRVVSLSYKGVGSRVWVAPDGKVARQVFQGAHPLTRAPGTVENVYSDYRAEGPLQFAFKQTLNVDGKKVADIAVEKVEVNPVIPEDAFKKPD